MALKKSKKKRDLPAPEVNVTSLMDVLTTLIFFIIMMAAFHNFVAIPATPLQAGKASGADQKPVFSLKIAMVSDKVAKFFLGATDGLDVIQRKEFQQYMKSKFSGSEATGFERTITEKDQETLITKIQEILAKLKESFPNETKAVVAFGDNITYQSTIDLLSSVRSLQPGREAASVPGVIGTSEKTRVLFPQVIISEWSEK